VRSVGTGGKLTVATEWFVNETKSFSWLSYNAAPRICGSARRDESTSLASSSFLNASAALLFSAVIWARVERFRTIAFL